jgi:hypothetical protein
MFAFGQVAPEPLAEVVGVIGGRKVCVATATFDLCEHSFSILMQS